MHLLWIALFGLAGIFSRYGLDKLGEQLATRLPVATFGINVLGSFLAGVIYIIGVERAHIPAALRIGIMVGFLGGFTTFSAFSLQSARLLEERQWGPALAYWLGSPALGVLAAWAGMALTRGMTEFPR